MAYHSTEAKLDLRRLPFECPISVGDAPLRDISVGIGKLIVDVAPRIVIYVTPILPPNLLGLAPCRVEN